MKCKYPIQGYTYYDPRIGETVQSFKEPYGRIYRHHELPCGRCMGCRINKSRDWATRMTHEAQQHDTNCFITLTYDKDHLPENASLNYKDWEKFLKRLRKSMPWKRIEYWWDDEGTEWQIIEQHKIRFYMAGEYGTDENAHSKLGRPHFHAIIFGWDFMADAVEHPPRPGKTYKTYTSPTLERIWGKGSTEFSMFHVDAAQYVAQYVIKKINGELADSHYARLDKVTGELIPIEREKARMSRRPAIGQNWYDKYQRETHKGFVTLEGKKRPVPRRYKSNLKEDNPMVYETLMEEVAKTQKHQTRQNLESHYKALEKEYRDRQTRKLK